MSAAITELFNQLPPQFQQEAIDFVQFLLDKTRRRIQQRPGVCGGDACIRDTRIPVWLLYSLRQQGAPDSELLENYPALTQADLDAAWEYQRRNPQEIAEAIAAND
jgi:uncharacterized protein (DUF433 family)